MKANRREFLSTLSLGGAALASGCAHRPIAISSKLITVTGPIPTAEMQMCLPHEHVMVDFIGANKVSRDRYKRDEVFQIALPHLKRIFSLGVRTFFECTPAFLGRDPLLLKQLSEASGLKVVTNTGYYGAGDNKFLPPHALSETAEQLAARWVQESVVGIEDTGVRPGFMKIGVGSGKLSELHAKLIQAAALAHGQTRLAIASHTGNGQAALDQLRILQENGVSPNAFIWVHAQSEKDLEIHLQAARQGAWLELDGISASTHQQHLEALQNLKTAELLGRVLISQDAGWYHVGEPGGGNYRGYDYLFTKFLPALTEAGFTAAEVSQLLIDNPAAAFGLRS